MINIEKLLDVAEELRLATYRAEHHGILTFAHNYSKDKEYFLIDKEEDFRALMDGRDYTIEYRNDEKSIYPYEYKVKIDGLNFVYLARELFGKDIKITICAVEAI